jgi:hypothetical protein
MRGIIIHTHWKRWKINDFRSESNESVIFSETDLKIYRFTDLQISKFGKEFLKLNKNLMQEKKLNIKFSVKTLLCLIGHENYQKEKYSG